MSTFTNLYRFINKITGGTLEILHTAFKGFGRCRGADAAAGLSYYTLMSLFPLLIVIVSVASSIFGSEQALQEAVVIIEKVIPVSQDIIEQNLERLLTLRAPLGLAGLLVSLWSATLVFATLASNINLAWSEAKSRKYIHRRFIGLMIVLILILFLFLSIFSTMLVKVLPQLNKPIFNEIPFLDKVLGSIPSTVLPWFFSFLLFYAFYNWIPNIRVSHRATILSAVVISIVWETTKLAFAWFISSGLAHYEILYGSLSTIILLMIWIYISALIILFGAHLCAAMDIHKFNKNLGGSRLTA